MSGVSSTLRRSELVNLALANEMLPVGGVKLTTFPVALIEEAAPEVAESINHLRGKDEDWQYVADFVNTIKHRGLVPHAFGTEQWRLHIKAFDYGDRHHDELSQREVETLVCRVQSIILEVLHELGTTLAKSSS